MNTIQLLQLKYKMTTSGADTLVITLVVWKLSDARLSTALISPHKPMFRFTLKPLRCVSVKSQQCILIQSKGKEGFELGTSSNKVKRNIFDQ